jgi:hypothetical protein
MKDIQYRKLGKLPAKHDKRTLKLEDYLDLPKLPTIPEAYNWTSGIALNWEMFLNDQIGDCTVAGAAHAEMSWSHDNKHIYVPSKAEVISAYTQLSGYNPQTGANDNGAALLDVLKLWNNTGIAGHKIDAYVSVNPQNQAMIQAAIYLFGLVYIGVELPLSAQTQTNWSVTDTSLQGNAAVDSWGGHCVILPGYDSNAGTKVITWGEEINSTWGFTNAYSDEMYAIISVKDFIKNGKAPNGFNLQQLLQDQAAIQAV